MRRYIVQGQPIRVDKKELAKQLRQEMTPQEHMLWQRLRRNGLKGFHFRRQQVIDGFVADFYCHRAGLVVEVDGGVHAGRVEYDRERDAILTARKLVVLRISNRDVERALERVLETIAAHLTPRPPSLRGKGETT
jgi:very-short-patch-repair endonuclease